MKTNKQNHLIDGVQKVFLYKTRLTINEEGNWGFAA